jgi:hypothetical protein
VYASCIGLSSWGLMPDTGVKRVYSYHCTLSFILAQRLPAVGETY